MCAHLQEASSSARRNSVSCGKFTHRLVTSAFSNAKNTYDFEGEKMYFSRIFAGDGPAMKRFKAGARGRYKPRKRRTSHLTLVLSQREAK